MRLLLLGATDLVGSAALKQAGQLHASGDQSETDSNLDFLIIHRGELNSNMNPRTKHF
jgi:hypothetical protein